MPHTLRGLKDFQLQNQTKAITLHKKKTVKEKSERDWRRHRMADHTGRTNTL